MTPLCIIPARTGSTRIVGKNFRPLNGLSPLERAIRCCLQIPSAQIVVTSDGVLPADSRVLMRHAPVAHQHERLADVVCDVLMTYPGEPMQPILLVQPTQPLRDPRDLVSALNVLRTHESVAAVTPTTSVDKCYMLSPSVPHLLPCGQAVERDQQTRPTYRCDGTVYGFRRDWFLAYREFRHPMTVPLIIRPSETAPLDTPHDWELAELRLREHDPCWTSCTPSMD
jgi:CMP-N-acetylneuraminic acid synthetase